MHTLVIVICGFVLLGLFIVFGWLWHVGTFPSVAATKLFIAVWAVISIVNAWLGVTRAGYSIGDELIVLPQVLLPPVIAAGLVLLAS